MTKQASALVALIEAVEKYDEANEGSTLIDYFCSDICPLRHECNGMTHEECIKYASEWDGVL